MSQKQTIQTAKQAKEYWLENSDANNFAHNLNFLQKYVCDFDALSISNKRWVFSHIPKTAGTSCENYLAQMFLIQDTIHINAPDINKLPELLSLKNNFPQFIAGHHPVHGLLYQLLPYENFAHITMLREPVARVVSYYNYLKSHQSHALHVNIKKMDFDDFIEQPMVELHNGQSKRLAGLLHSQLKVSDIDILELAKNVIDTCFTLVGITEKLEEFLQVIEKKCKVKIHRTEPKNPSKINLNLNNLTNNQLEKIINYNKADILLYEYVLEKFSDLENKILKEN